MTSGSSVALRPLAWAVTFALAAGAPPVLPATSTGATAPAVDRDATAPAVDDTLARLARRLALRLKPALRAPCLADAAVGMTVRDLETGRVLFVDGGDRLLVPASNQKLLTAAALLGLLGPEHSLATRVRADHEPDAAGSVGRLYLVGGGDPSLNVEALYLTARALAAAGVRRVSAVIADDSLFADEPRVPSWPARNHPFWYGAPSSALSAAYNVVAVHARGGPDGSRPEVWVDPFPSFFDVQNQARTGRGPLRVDSVPLTATEGVGQRLQVAGRVRPGQTERVLRAVESPPLFCAHGFVETLRRVGITVDEGPSLGRAPADSALLHVQSSRPLALLLHDMNKQSSNVFAETLLKVLGAEVLGPPGTRVKGLRAVETFVASLAPDIRRCRLEDGSGLSPENRLTTDVLTQVLCGMSRDPLTWPEFLVTLPVSGTDGTLKRRLDSTRAQRLVRAKTGRLGHVVALTGTAPVDGERRGAFSVLVNDYHCPTWKVQDAVDRVVLALLGESPPAESPGERRAQAVEQQDAPGEKAHGGGS